MAYEKQNFQQGQILTAEAMNKMDEELARKKSWDELEDKPFYSETETYEVWPENTVTFNGDSSIVPGTIDIVFGGKYTVVWNGVEYELTAVSSLYMGMAFVVVGNCALFGGGDDTGEPFAIGTVTGGDISGLFTANPGETVTVKILGEREIVQPLDPKYVTSGWAWAPISTKGYLDVVLENYVVDGDGNNENNDNYNVNHVRRAKTATVIFDGEEFVCPAVQFDDCVVFGNGSIGGGLEDTGEPFNLYFYAHEGLSVGIKDSSKSHTITMTVTERYDAMAPQFMPTVLTSFVMESSESYKKFRVTINDAGELSAAEITYNEAER